jgi:hypothetical protein
MTYFPDHYRYPVPAFSRMRGLGMSVRASALDVAEEATGRRLPADSAVRLGEREQRSAAHTHAMRWVRRRLDECFGR